MDQKNTNVLENQQINISVFSYRPESHGSSKILYSISITTRTRITWVLEKRYSSFEKLQEELKLYFGEEGLPSLPKKTYLSFIMSKSHNDIEDRRLGLDTYLKLLVVRTDIFNSIPLREFLEIDKHYSEGVINPPQMICEIDNFLHGVRDFHIDYTQRVMFIINSDTNLFTRLDAYITNMKLPWDSEQNGDGQVMIPVGCVECWVHGENGQFERAWTKMYNSQAISLFWDPNDCILMVGLDSGNINLLKVPQLDTNFRRYDESTEIEQHYGRVMGLYYDTQYKLVHSISKDRRYRVLDLKRQALIADYEAGVYDLTYLYVDSNRKRSFVGDKCGSVYVYDTTKSKPQAIVHLETGVRSVRGLDFDDAKNYLFVLGYEEGDMVVYDVNKAGWESQAKIVARYKNKPFCRELCWSKQRGEIYVGNQDGTITIWEVKKNEPIYVYRAHESAITRMKWIESDLTLLSSAKDKVIKAWKMPQNWRDKQVVQDEEMTNTMNNKINQMVQIQKKNQRDDSGDEDELNQWHH